MTGVEQFYDGDPAYEWARFERHPVEFAGQKAREAGVDIAACVRADVRDLSAFDDESFDVVLLMGPLYHLLEHADRLQAVRDARRLVRPGGRIFATFVNRLTMLRNGLASGPEWIVECREQWEDTLATGVCPGGRRQGRYVPDMWLCHPDNIEFLMSTGGFSQITVVAAESLVGGQDDQTTRIPDHLWDQWATELHRVAKEPSVLGAATHLLYVGSTGRT